MVSLGSMPLLNDYSLCRDVVTVYHEEGGEVTRIVHPRAYLELGKSGDVGRTGSGEDTGFLLVVPGADQACHVGDKVMLGEGPDVPADDVMKWWRAFIPVKVDGLAVVRRVYVRRWDGGPAHTEASG